MKSKHRCHRLDISGFFQEIRKKKQSSELFLLTAFFFYYSRPFSYSQYFELELASNGIGGSTSASKIFSKMAVNPSDKSFIYYTTKFQLGRIAGAIKVIAPNPTKN